MDQTSHGVGSSPVHYLLLSSYFKLEDSYTFLSSMLSKDDNLTLGYPV